MTVLGKIGLELIEEAPPAFPHTQCGQSVALRTRIIELRLGESVLHELAQRHVHRHAVVDETAGRTVVTPGRARPLRLAALSALSKKLTESLRTLIGEYPTKHIDTVIQAWQ